MVLRLYGCNKRAKRSDYKETRTTAADTFKDACFSDSFQKIQIPSFIFIFCVRLLLNSQEIVDIDPTFHARVKSYQKA